MLAMRRLLDGILLDTKAAGKTLDPAATYVGLYVTGPTANPPATAADFTLPDATDVPAVAIGSWSAPYRLNDGRSVQDSPAKVFRLPNATNSFTAAGWYLATAAVAGNIIGYEPFPTAIPLPDETKVVTVIVRIAVAATGLVGAAIVVDG